jgi:hypothetical protein
MTNQVEVNIRNLSLKFIKKYPGVIEWLMFRHVHVLM